MGNGAQVRAPALPDHGGHHEDTRHGSARRILLTAIASPSRAQNIVVWRTIIGIEQAGNDVGGINGGGQPWSAHEGEALVELTSGLVVFEVRGLVLAGGNTIGTPGAVNQVKG